MSEQKPLLPPGNELRRPCRNRTWLKAAAIGGCVAFLGICVLTSGMLKPTAEPEPSPTVAPAATFTELVPKGSGMPAAAKVTVGGKNWAVSMQGDTAMIDGSPVQVDAARVKAVLGTGASVIARASMTGDPADFGLAAPAVTVVYTYPDGSEWTLRLGNAPVTGSGRYAMVSGDDAIYLVNTSLYDALAVNKEAFYTVPTLNEYFTSERIMTLSLVRPGHDEMVIRRVTEANPHQTVAEFVTPLHYPCNATRTGELFLAMDGLQPVSVLTLRGEDQEWGLDTPLAVLTLTTEEQTTTLRIGQKIGQSEDTLTLRINDDQAVYALKPGAVDFLPKATVAWLAEQTPGLTMLNQLRRLTLTAEGETIAINVEQQDGQVVYQLDDGRVLDSKDFQNAYRQCIGLLIERYEANPKEGWEPDTVLTFELNDEVFTLAFAPYNDGYDLIVRDGDAHFLISSDKVDAMVEAVRKLK